MTAGELETWLDTEQSRDVGQKDGGESIGHAGSSRPPARSPASPR
ncbi:DUF3140 domain-containing protein [Streptomyces microflavus]|nr:MULTISPECIES: DUF3140 domain-containing protein [Streptomyces]MBK5995777.1 DUF3140 domain-containing protein [Streptomyces sp. MBT58]MBW3363038.1 DUF3140 domain-containing protein [Streptomyces sp. 09ZI22]